MREWMRKRLLPALLAVLMALSPLPLTPNAQAAEEEDVTGSISATLRIDYAQSLDELQERGVQVQVRQGDTVLGTVPLAEPGEYPMGSYQAIVSARNNEGGDLNGGLWPGYLDLDVKGLPRGSYTLSFTGRGYVSYEKTVEMQDHARHIIVGTGDASFTLGDVNGDGKVDVRDRTDLSAALDSASAEDLARYDLDGDGQINIIDLAYVNRQLAAQGDAEALETYLLAPPVTTYNIQAALHNAGTDLKSGNLEDLFLDNGKSVQFSASSGGDIILPLPLDTAVMMTEIQLVTPVGAGEILAGHVLVEEEDGTETVIPFDQTPPEGTHAISRTPGSSIITINLGKRVPVKMVTVTVTKTAEGNYAAVEMVQFLQDIVPENPSAPNSMVKNLKAEAANESVNLRWSELPNVSGYKILYWPKDKEAEIKELHVDVTSALVTGLENMIDYLFTVTPTDGSWEGKPCEPVLATPWPSKVPDKTDMVSVTAMDGALSVSWKAGKNATYFMVYYQEKGASEWIQAGGQLTEPKVVIEGLTNGVTYSLYVVAGNDMGLGPQSDIAEGTPKAVAYERPAGIPTQGILDNGKIASIVLADPNNVNRNEYTADAPFVPENMIDGDYRTHWTASNWWKNEHVVCTFTEPVDLSAVIWVPRLDGSYPSYLRAYSVRVWYEGEDLNGAGHLLMPDPNTGGVDNGGVGDSSDVHTWPGIHGNPSVTNFAIMPFDPALGVVKISVAAEQSAYNTVSLSELMFMEYDPAHCLPDDIDKLFTDKLHTALVPGVTTAQIEELAARLESDERDFYLYPEVMEDDLKLARELLDTGRSSGVVIEGIQSRSGAADSQFKQGGSVYQPLGVSASAKSAITVYADGIPDGGTVTVYATQFNAEVSAWQASIGTLRNGRNVLTVPQLTSNSKMSKGGSLYVTYSGAGAENIRLHVRRGVDIPALELADWYDLTELERREAIGAYVDELEAYLAATAMSTDADWRNVTEISTPVVLLSLPAKAVNGALGQSGREQRIDTLYDSILAWEDVMHICKTTQGIDGTYENNEMQTRQNIRCMTMFTGAFMYAAGSHIGIGYGSCGGMVTGRPIGSPRGEQLFGWGIAHEIGHNMDKLGKAEITNNIYSIMVQTYDGNANTKASRLEASNKYPAIFTKTAQGYPGASGDVFAQLGMYWQLHLAYDGADDPLGFYNRFFKAWKDGTYFDGASSYDDRFALTASAVAGTDLSEFFTRWGMRLSDSTLSTLQSYPREERAVWYLNDQSRRDAIAGVQPASVSMDVYAVARDTEVTLNIDVRGDTQGIQGYEIRRNGTSIAFTTEAHYVDVIGSANHRVFDYEVIAYDTQGYEAGSARSNDIRIAYDRLVPRTAYEIAEVSGGIEVRFREETAISGLKLAAGTWAPSGDPVTVEVTDADGLRTVARSTHLDQGSNQAVDDAGSFLTYFRKPGTSDTRIWTYDAMSVTITGLPAETDLESIGLVTYPGDDIAFLEEGAVGVLAADYRYAAVVNGQPSEQVIPAGTLVIAGTYRGDPLYNTIKINGVFLETTINEAGEPVETELERLVDGYALLFAEVPEDGAVSDISDGIFLFVPNVQREAELQGADEEHKCEAKNLLPSQIQAILSRTNLPDSTEGQRVTAETMWINSPGGLELPTIVLE